MTTREKPGTKPKSGALPLIKRRLLNAAVDIQQDPPAHIDFLHTTMCQVGLPRSRVSGTVFERTNGNSVIRLESGAMMLGGKMKEQPLPYGTHPRLIMVYISSEAIKTKNRVIEVGDSTREFLRRLGISEGGGPRGGLTTFKKQMQALVACRLTLGYSVDGHDTTIYAKPIHRFDAWLPHDENQMALWPGIMELSQEFYDSLKDHAVPLDHRALRALKHSSLALDIYCWLAHRLYRIRNHNGVFLSWGNLQDQFGQEYGDPKNFRRKFNTALRQVKAVYPSSIFEIVTGGMKFYVSPPPIPAGVKPASMPAGLSKPPPPPAPPSPLREELARKMENLMARFPESAGAYATAANVCRGVASWPGRERGEG